MLLGDDIDGSEATETLSFALDGSDYEIDVNEGHAKERREPWPALPTPGVRYPVDVAVLHLILSPRTVARRLSGADVGG